MTKNPLTCVLLLCIFAGSWSEVLGATITLREHASIQGSIVYLGDVAEIAASSTGEHDYLATTPLLPTPAEGTSDCIHQPRLRQLLLGQGIDVEQLHVEGAPFVEVGTSVAIPEAVAEQTAEPLPERSVAELEQDIISAIKRRLVEQTGHEDWEIELSLSKADYGEIQIMGADLVATSGRAPWNGSQRFLISAPSSENSEIVLARVDKIQQVVVATRRLDAGELLSASDVELRRESGSLPSGVYTSLEQVLGKEALRAIPEGTILQSNQVRSPLLVRRGETAKVTARTGGISVSTYAVVRQDGALGDLVQVETLEGKERFAARVAGWKQLEVMPTGVTTADFAEASSRGVLLR